MNDKQDNKVGVLSCDRVVLSLHIGEGSSDGDLVFLEALKLMLSNFPHSDCEKFHFAELCSLLQCDCLFRIVEEPERSRVVTILKSVLLIRGSYRVVLFASSSKSCDTQVSVIQCRGEYFLLHSRCSRLCSICNKFLPSMLLLP